MPTWCAGLKNTSTQSAENETVAATKVYDAFGNEVSTSGSWSGPFSYAGNFGYQSDANGLKLLGHRYYDSSTGRFLSLDPTKDGRNWFTYCHNAPVNFADPNGLTAATLYGWAAVAVVADGPLPIGDVVAIGLAIAATTVAIVEMARSDPPFTGNPGDTVVGPNTSRRYGPDGYPEVDRDYDPTHKPADHSHDWGRPGEGGPPTHEDRGKPRPPVPEDPPPPLNSPPSMAGIITGRGIIYQ